MDATASCSPLSHNVLPCPSCGVPHHARVTLLPVGAFSASVTHARAAGPLSFSFSFSFTSCSDERSNQPIEAGCAPPTCWTIPIQPGAHCHHQTSIVSLDEYPVDGHVGTDADTATIPLRHDNDTLRPLLVMAVMTWSRDVHAVRLAGLPSKTALSSRE